MSTDKKPTEQLIIDSLEHILNVQKEDLGGEITTAVRWGAFAVLLNLLMEMKMSSKTRKNVVEALHKIQMKFGFTDSSIFRER